MRIECNIIPPLDSFVHRTLLKNLIDKDELENICKEHSKKIASVLWDLGISTFTPQNKNIANYIELNYKRYLYHNYDMLYPKFDKKDIESIWFLDTYLDKSILRALVKSVWECGGSQKFGLGRVWFVLDYKIEEESNNGIEKIYINFILKYKIQK
jgi:hypothetical protein